MTASARKIAQGLGSLDAIADDLEAFQQSARAFAALYPKLVDEYDGQWVALYDKRVIAHAADLPAILRQIDDLSIPRAASVVQFVTKQRRTLIL